MKLKTEMLKKKQQILIVGNSHYFFLEELKNQLKKFDNEVFVSPHLPETVNQFDVFYVVNNPHFINTLIDQTGKKIVFIVVDNHAKALHLTNYIQTHARTTIKVISIKHPEAITSNEIERILWFSFARTTEVLLSMHLIETVKLQKKNTSRRSWSFFQTRTIVFTIVFFIFTLHSLFIFPLLYATLFNIRAANKILKNGQIDAATAAAKKAQSALAVSESLYMFARPTLLLFGIVIFPDNLIEANKRASKAFYHAQQLSKDGSLLLSLALKKDKTIEEKEQILHSVTKLSKEIDSIEENLSIVYQKLPEWNSSLRKQKKMVKDTSELINTFRKFIPFANQILAKDSEKQYLLLFANNMEIRPGGGFIGSFGILTVKDLTVQKLQVYDVYDADGQLKVHITPPKAIIKYLNQPHWFLRDSAFSPDFRTNYLEAVNFLSKEFETSRFDGGIIITTSAIQNLLSAIGSLYIPDFRETINKDNFYLKAQLYAEKDFFPGSLQKKQFLSSVVNQILISLEQTQLPQVLQALRKTLDEKQAALYFEDQNLQETVNSLYWSGEMIVPTCASSSKNCTVDYLFPVDANLGVNKANFFVTRTYNLEIRLNSDSSIKNLLTIVFKNDSPNAVFPGGTYKNYFQIVLPKTASIKNITKNDTLVEEFDERTDLYKTLGMYIEIKPQSETTVSLTYQLPPSIRSGQGAYQLIVQKQIGSPNSDLNLKITLPNNIFITNQNFSPLVKGNAIIYNTVLSADKIFFIDLVKE